MVDTKHREESLVSIIVPLYNHQNYVEKCLGSMAQEGHNNIEVIVLDDGSTDDSYHIVKKWRDNNSNIFKSFVLERQENIGFTKTLNRLLKMSHGDFIVLIASDDYLLPGGIEARLNALKAHPKWLAVFGDCRVVDEHENVLYESGIFDFYKKERTRREALFNEKLIGAELALRWSVPGPVFMMKREAMDVVGYYNESYIVEDYDYYLRLLNRYALGYVDFKVACYRLHSNNTIINKSFNYEGILNLADAALKNSFYAKGLMKYALLLRYYSILNQVRESEVNINRIYNRAEWILLRACRKLLNILQDVRFYLE